LLINIAIAANLFGWLLVWVKLDAKHWTYRMESSQNIRCGTSGCGPVVVSETNFLWAPTQGLSVSRTQEVCDPHFKYIVSICLGTPGMVYGTQITN
jgi:hypothetical protein